GIKGYAQLLGERITDERSQRFAALIAQEAVRLEGLVNDLLDYARQDDPGDGCTLLDEELLNNAWGMMSGHADVQMVKLELSISPGAQVACRPDRLRQLLINLFSNALQVIAPEGTVRVSVTEGREMVTLKVQDTGADATLVTLPLSVFLYPTDKSGISPLRSRCFTCPANPTAG
ncbi:MAG: HAMP domain-containing histidine kinase, partial [Proteobacteria bacterium]|nr:HAMP domain-containing histidine kinase [Pseudomonadota bacterium]